MCVCVAWMDFYDALKVDPDASLEDIRNGYLSMSRLHHPDKTSSGDAGVFREVNRAYKVLSDPTLRTFYDKHGFAATELAESVADQLVLVAPVDKLSQLERRVRGLIRSSDELNVQRWLQPQVEITMGARILQYNSPFYYSWSHTATSAGIAMLSGKYSLSVFVSSHMQRGGAGVSRATIVLGTAFTPTLTSRAMLHVMGGRWPGIELMLQKQISDETVIRQTFGFGGSITAGAEWIQQLGVSLIGTLGVSFAGTRGISLELAKKDANADGGSFVENLKAKIRLGLVSSGEVSIGGKVKFLASDKLEIHIGPTVSSTTGVALELAVQTELEPIVEEQEGAFPTFFTWSLSLGIPTDLTLGLKLSRGGFNFNFPIELPQIETKWALITGLALWTLAPFVANQVGKIVRKPSLSKQVCDYEGETERNAIIPEAVERRRTEENCDGLVIVNAIYANKIDVTNVLMAKVRNSTLTLSSETKSTLVGFRHPTAGHNLVVVYKYGGKVYERTFADNEIVILP